jgi:hypothetical protein
MEAPISSNCKFVSKWQRLAHVLDVLQGSS